MIDLLKAKQELKEFVKQYDYENDRIRVKIAHIERVSGIAKEIAEGLNLSEEEVQLAELIGLLHDIGRFEQVRRYNTFIDEKSVNHGELGVEILFQEGMIRNFIQDEQYDEIIRKAILNHNRGKEKIETADNRELLYTQIIRDADKADILYMLTFQKKETAWGNENLEKEKISDEIYREFIEEKSICYANRKTAMDVLVSHFAYVYDLHYQPIKKIVKEKEYFSKLYHRFHFEEEETKERMKKIYAIVEEYLEKE